ncbi:MAG: LysR family transcriptional regulator, partial [Lachnospiraceae bacterium]|nr:LysR family transcriptional regulator [Lachnospiraceae bacterium]
VFKRTSVGVRVKEEGAQFLYHAKRIMEQFEAVGRICDKTGSDKLQYKLSIARGSYIVDGFTSFVSELQLEKGMEITINETNAMGTIVNVADKGYNIGVIRYQAKDEDYYLNCLKSNHLTNETIWEFEYVLVMSEKHPLAKKEDITIEDLKGYTKITHGDIELPHDKYSGKTKKNQNRNVIYVYERGSQFDLLSNVPNTYMWVSPIPEKVLKKNRLIQRVCKAEDNLYKDVLIFREDYHINEYDRLFQKKLYESKVDVASAKW